MSYLSIQGLHKRYGDTAIFSDINCEIAKGEFITLLGPSGCGKSTLLRCIAGLTGVNGGQILLDGEDLVPVAPQKRGIGMVFQSYALFPNMTVQQNVAFGLRMQKVKGSEAEQRVKEVLELVELNDFAGRYPQQLSGGQCQRVALARSLVTRPRLLLLDEPLSALDARIRKHLREQIRQIQRWLAKQLRPALILQHQQPPLDGAHGFLRHKTIAGRDRFGILGHEGQQGLQVVLQLWALAPDHREQPHGAAVGVQVMTGPEVVVDRRQQCRVDPGGAARGRTGHIGKWNIPRDAKECFDEIYDLIDWEADYFPDANGPIVARLQAVLA